MTNRSPEDKSLRERDSVSAPSPEELASRSLTDPDWHGAGGIDTPHNAHQATTIDAAPAQSCSELASDSINLSDLTPDEQRQALAAMDYIEQLRRDCPGLASAKNESSFAELGKPKVPSLPSHIGKYEIVSSSGRGGFAEVFLAIDPDLDRRVALKVPLIVGASDQQSQQRFQREAKAAALLSHPLIVPVYEVGSIGAIDYIAFEYCSGPTLAQWMEDSKSESDQRSTAAIVAALAEAVQHAHQRGVIHRDLKPSNILIDNRPEHQARPLSSRVRITDFGLAYRQWTNDPSLTIEGTAIGTPAYMSPEQVVGRSEPNQLCDVYALGMIMYEMLTGILPFRRSNHLATLKAVESEEPPALRSWAPLLSPELEAICLKCLAKDPAARYPTAHDLSEDLNRWLQGLPVTAKRLSSLQRTWRWVQRHRLTSSLACLVLISLLTGIGMTTWQSQVARNNLKLMEQERTRAQSQLSSMVLSFDQILAGLPLNLVDSPRMSTQQKGMLEQIVKLQQELLTFEESNDRLQGRASIAQLKLAKIFIRLGQYDEARKHLNSAEQGIHSIPDDNEHILLQAFLADAAIERAVLANRQHDQKTALNRLAESAEILDSLQNTEVADSVLMIRINYFRTLGMVREQALEFDAALEAYEEGVKLAQQRAADPAPYSDSHQVDFDFAWASSLNSLAVLQSRTARPEASVATYRSAKQVIDRLIQQYPLHHSFLGLATAVDLNLGNAAFRAKNWSEAEMHYRATDERTRILLVSNPDDVANLQVRADALGMLGATEAKLGQWESARKHFDQSMEQASRLGDQPIALSTRLRSANNLARMLNEDLQQFEDAEVAYAGVVAEAQSAIAKYPREFSFVRSLAVASGALGGIYLEQSDYVNANRMLLLQKETLLEAIQNSHQDRELSSLLTTGQRDFSNMYLSQRELDQAKQALIEIADLPPRSADMAYRSARELWRMHTETGRPSTRPESITVEDWTDWRKEILDACYQQLELAIQRKLPNLGILETEDPIWEPLRPTTRFQELLKSVR